MVTVNSSTAAAVSAIPGEAVLLLYSSSAVLGALVRVQPCGHIYQSIYSAEISSTAEGIGILYEKID